MTSFASIDWQAWQPTERATLVFVVRAGHILLIRKKRGLGAGKINGPGGRIEPGEAALECAVREVQEELCITPLGVRPSGRLSFQFTDGYALQVEVFRADDFEGVPRETDEAAPLLTPIAAIPYHEMWDDDRVWLPHLLAERPFRGRFLYAGEAMLGHELETD